MLKIQNDYSVAGIECGTIVLAWAWHFVKLKKKIFFLFVVNNFTCFVDICEINH